jgi:hypothetical protein
LTQRPIAGPSLHLIDGLLSYKGCESLGFGDGIGGARLYH